MLHNININILQSNPSTLRHYLMLQSIKIDRYGQVVHKDLGYFWGHLMPITGIKSIKHESQERTATHVIKARYRNDINANKLIKFDGRVFMVLRAYDPNEEKRFIKILVQEDCK